MSHRQRQSSRGKKEPHAPGSRMREKNPTVSVRQSCDSTTDGHNTFHVWQKMMTSMQSQTDVHPRRDFLEDLRQFLSERIGQDSSVAPITSGDWSETPQDNTRSRQTLERIGPADIWEHRHLEENFSTHSRGRRRINFMLAPPSFANGIKITHKPLHSRLKGDHQGWNAMMMSCLETSLTKSALLKAGS